MHYSRFGAFAALDCAGYQPHATGAAVAGAAVIWQFDAIAKSRVQQQLAAGRSKTTAIDCYLVMNFQ
jgi:hypothetical protein